MKISYCEQLSEEWFNSRVGHMTGSHAQAIANCGKGLDTYIRKTMSEVYSSGERENFSNKHTDRGNELEPIARNIYELETGNDVKQVGFIKHNNYVMCSPDGLIDDDGGIEIKCIDDFGYFNLLLDEKIDTKYIWQIQMNLLISKRKWWDFVVYNPNFKKSIIIQRILPDKEKFAKLEQGLIEGEKQIKSILKKLI